METKSKHSRECGFDGQSYSHGEEICRTDGCRRCNDGRWEERFEDLVFGVGP